MTSSKSLFVNIVKEMILGFPLSLLLCLLDNSRAQDETPYMLHYDYKGNFWTLKHSLLGTEVDNETVTFKFDSFLILDFGSRYVVHSITIHVNNAVIRTVNVTLGLRGNYNIDKDKYKSCSRTYMSSLVLFYCNEMGRFAQIHTDQTLNVTRIDVDGTAIYSELYVGCFQHNYTLSRDVKDVTECMKFCDFINHTYAAVKDAKCGCYKNVNGLLAENHTSCHTKCGYDQLCTSGVNYIGIYFSDYQFLEGPENISIECILSNNENCNNCEPGYKGIFCDKRDCTVNNGDCGELECFDYNNDNFIPYDARCVCLEGYQNALTSVCKDINECENPHKYPCTWREYCLNLPGYFKCRCRRGFNTTETDDCIDIDECLIYAICEEKSSLCVNNLGSYVCQCRTGYKPHNDSKNSCTDIDECHELKYCPESCLNTIGSFICRCQTGFLFENQTSECEDVDECQLVTLCDKSSTKCHNTIGTFVCNCSEGYSRYSAYKCEDINECILNIHTCDKSATCRNFPGHYNCLCPSGLLPQTFKYVRTCVDIDECSITEDICEANKSLCLNTYGSFKCQCLGRYENRDFLSCRLRTHRLTSTDYYDGFTPEYSVMGDEAPYVRLYLYGFISFVLLVAAGVAITIRARKPKKPARRPNQPQGETAAPVEVAEEEVPPLGNLNEPNVGAE